MMTANDLCDVILTAGKDLNFSIISEAFNIFGMTSVRRPSPTFFIGERHSDVNGSA